MKMSNKQKASVATAVAISVIAAQSYFLVDKQKEYNVLEEKLNKEIKQTEILMKKNKEITNKVNSLTNTIKEKDETISSLEREKVKLNQEVKRLKSGVYPTSVSRGTYSRNIISTNKGTPIKMTLTFYGDGANENGGYAGIDAQGNKLVAGTIASNVYPFNTKFSLNGQIFTVRDRGGKHFNSYNRLDVFVPRQSGESDYEYNKRIRSYGKKTVTMYKLN